MKIYFAGPLFTPYVRQFISDHAQILRDNGIEPFVPHESFRPEVTDQMLESLIQQGLLTREALQQKPAVQLVADLVRAGTVGRGELGLAPVTPQVIFEKDLGGLASSNAVVAILDGTQVDDGTACEIGIFHGLMRKDPSKKGVIGYLTDFRALRNAEKGFGLNHFVLGVIEEGGMILDNFEDVIKQLKAWDAEL